jgi:hypothetical protein
MSQVWIRTSSGATADVMTVAELSDVPESEPEEDIPAAQPRRTRRAARAKKDDKVLRYMLTVQVAYGKKLLVNEFTMETTTVMGAPAGSARRSFSYPAFAQKEAKAIESYSTVSSIDLKRVRGKATVSYGTPGNARGRQAATIDAFPAGMLPPPFAGEVQHGKQRSHSDSPPSKAMPMPTQVFNFGMGFNGPPAPQEHAPQRQASSPPLRSRQIPGITTPQVLDKFFQCI